MDDATDGQSLRLLEKPKRLDRPSEGGTTDSEEGDTSREDGLNLWQTAISISGGSAGYGFLAVEVLVVSTGWAGFLLFSLVYSAMVFTSVLLGRCWNMVRDRWGAERHPYGAIGEEAFGGWARTFVNVLMASVGFTNAVAVLLGFTETTLILGGPALQGTLCYWPLIYGLVVCPFLWLGTPRNFWLILATSFFTVFLTVFLVIISVFVAGKSTSSSFISNASQGALQETEFLHLAEIAGTTIWLMGLHGSFPTVQQDMQQPQVFGKAVVLADMMTLFLAVPVMLALFIVYGSTLTHVTGSATVFVLLPDDALKTVSAVLILVHLAGVVLLMNNPLFQYLEERLNIPAKFGWKRVALRSSVLLGQVFIQETLPHFTLLTALSGGLLTPLLTLVIPCVFYLRLRNQHRNETSKWSTLETVVCYVIIGGTPCLMAAILFGTGLDMVRGKTVFTVPCYVNATLASL